MGVVHHGRALAWLEEARSEWLRDHLGLDYTSLTCGGRYAFPVREISVEYARAMLIDQVVTVHQRLHIPAEGLIDFYAVLRVAGNRSVAVAARVRHVACSTDGKALSQLPPHLEVALRAARTRWPELFWEHAESLPSVRRQAVRID